jgi:hypothetical protein
MQQFRYKGSVFAEPLKVTSVILTAARDSKY